MKKIFTLALGAMVALSMYAAPRGLQTNISMKSARFNGEVVLNQSVDLKAPAGAGETITITSDNLVETTYSGYPLLYGYDNSYEVDAILFPEEGAEDAYGSYTSASDNIMLYLFDLSIDSDPGSELTVITAVYSQTAEGLNHLVVNAMGEDGTRYNIDMTGEPMSPYEYDDESDFSHVFPTYVVDETYLATYGSVYVTAEDNDYYIVLDITVPEGASSLVAGQYPVAEDYDYQTVYAGYYDVTYGIVPSVAATLIEQQGEVYYNQIWYIVSGTVTVNADGSIDVAAVNSLGKTITATLQSDASAVENVTAEQTSIKRLVEGQLVIERNGVRYNVQGVEVK